MPRRYGNSPDGSVCWTDGYFPDEGVQCDVSPHSSVRVVRAGRTDRSGRSFFFSACLPGVSALSRPQGREVRAIPAHGWCSCRFGFALSLSLQRRTTQLAGTDSPNRALLQDGPLPALGAVHARRVEAGAPHQCMLQADAVTVVLPHFERAWTGVVVLGRRSPPRRRALLCSLTDLLASRTMSLRKPSARVVRGVVTLPSMVRRCSPRVSLLRRVSTVRCASRVSNGLIPALDR
jgi:hypothetical protein